MTEEPLQIRLATAEEGLAVTYEEASKRLMITPQVIGICCLEELKHVFTEEADRQARERYECEIMWRAR